MIEFKHRLSTKLFISIAIILFVICAFIYGALYVLMPKAYVSYHNDQIEQELDQITQELSQASEDEFGSVLLGFKTTDEGMLTIYDIDRNEAIISYGTYVDIEGETKSSNEISYTRQFSSNGVQYTLTYTGESVMEDQITRIFIRILPIVIIIILILSLITAYIFSRIYSKPIEEISKSSIKMAKLDLSERSHLRRSDEIGLLSNNLNAMAANLQEALNDLNNANDELLKDIRQKETEEKRRRDFFAAISHELKTPVTILKGELDGMINDVGKFKDRDKYLKKALTTTESIESLMKDLLDLARLDSLSLNVSPVDLSSMVEEVLRAHRILAEEKRLNIEFQITQGIGIKVDESLFRKAISNIIGNAMIHSPIEAEITVKTEAGEEGTTLSIENSGPNIRTENLEKIYEPFYRIDRSRSKDTGGTGLGLYIVKNILELHDFEYRLENTDSGVRFVIKM